MKTIINISYFLLALIIINSCKAHWDTVQEGEFSCAYIAANLDGNFTDTPYATNYVFYNWYKVEWYVCGVNKFLLRDNYENIADGSDIRNSDPTLGYDFGTREGKFKNGVQHGLWECERSYHFDSLGYRIYKRYRFREEYFKNGLRDSIFKIYNKEGDIIYATLFNKGTGIEKDFHENGKLYYEIETKEGQFTDTLKLYDKDGDLSEKRLYKEGVLLYYESGSRHWIFKYSPNDSTYLDVDSYETKNFKKGKFKNTFHYKTKEEFDNDYFAQHTFRKL